MVHYSNFKVVEQISQFDWILTADRTTVSWFGFVKKTSTVEISTCFFPRYIECLATTDLTNNYPVHDYNNYCKIAILKYLKGKE